MKRILALLLLTLTCSAQLPPTEFGTILLDRYPDGLALRWFAPAESFWVLERSADGLPPWVADQWGDGLGQVVARKIPFLRPSAMYRVKLESILTRVCLDFVWDANPEPDIIAYRIYWGLVSRNYSDHVETGNVTAYTVCDSFRRGRTYYFSLTAINSAGLESDFSDELMYTVPQL